MATKPKSYTPKFKFQLVLDFLQGERSEVELGRIYGVHHTTISKWKRQFLDHGAEVFSSNEEVKRYEKRVADLGSGLSGLISELFDYYERGAPYIETDFQERRLPMVQEWEAQMQATIAGLVREALRPVRPDKGAGQAVSALLDFSTFKSFLERDVRKEQVAKIMSEILLC